MTDRRGGLPLWEQEHGRVMGRCRECGAPVPKGRVSWCSQDCVGAHRARTDPGYQRVLVFQRDGGVCAECGRDCVALRRDLLPLTAWHGNAVALIGVVSALDGKLPDAWRRTYPQYDADGIEKAIAIVNDLGLLKHLGNRDSLWDLDHRVPLWRGGVNELNNLRTLCIPCHREATRAGSAQRASQRRQA